MLMYSVLQDPLICYQGITRPWFFAVFFVFYSVLSCEVARVHPTSKFVGTSSPSFVVALLRAVYTHTSEWNELISKATLY